MPGRFPSYSAMKDSNSLSVGKRGSQLKATRRGSQAALVITDPKATGAPASALVADLMERAGSGWYQALVLPSLLGVTVVECGQVQLISNIAGGLQLEWGLTNQQKALIPALSFLGLAFGTVLSGIFSDYLGRRKAIVGGFALSAISSTCLAFASSYAQMSMCTILNGLASGIGVTAAMVMITELCPRELRATAFIFPLFAQGVGEVYAVAMAEVFMPDLLHGDWRAVVLFAAAPAYAFLFMSMVTLRESPYWLVVQGRVLEAQAEILEIAKCNRTTQHVEILAEALHADVEADSTNKGDGQGMQAVMRKAFGSAHFLLMFASFAFLCFLGQLLTFGMSYYWPALLESDSVDIAFMDPATTLGLIRSFGIPSALLMVPIMQSKVGHRTIISVSGVLESLVLLGCVLVLMFGRSGALVPLACVSLGCANLFYATSLLFMTESYPTSVRAVMSALSVSLGRVGAICGPSMVESLGFQSFLVVAGLLALLAVPVTFYLVETKGKQLDDFLEEDVAPEAVPLMGEKDQESMSETNSDSDSAPASCVVSLGGGPASSS